MDITKLTNEEMRHIFKCKDRTCFFCENAYDKIFGRDKKIEIKEQEQDKQHKNTRGWTPELDAEIKTLRQQGLSYQKISDRIGKNKISVLLRIKNRFPELMGRRK